MRKVLFVASVTGHIKAFHLPYLKMFKERGFQVDVAAKETVALPEEYHTYNISFERSPFHKSNIYAYKQLKKIMIDNDYDIVHCHTPVASILARLACRSMRKNGVKVYYTAHGFHFFKGAPLKNWLLYYPIEKLCARFTDVLITINQEDYHRAKKKMKAKEVVYVPGVGINLEKFGHSKADRLEKRKELCIPEDAHWLLNIGELIPRKNQETIIRAISNMPEIYLTIAGKGPLVDHLRNIIEELNLTDRVQLLGFRTDISDLCHSADAFIFASFHEGLPVAVMESMASGLPCIVSKIRGNVDLIDESGGICFDPHSIEDCRVALKKLFNTDLRAMGERNKEYIKEFSLENVMQYMYSLYEL